MGYESLSNLEAAVKQDPELQETADSAIGDAFANRTEDLAATSEIDGDEIGDSRSGSALRHGAADAAEDETADETEDEIEKKPGFLLRSLPTMAVGIVIGVAIALGGMGFADTGKGNAPATNSDQSGELGGAAAGTTGATQANLPDASQTVTVAGVKSDRIARTLEATGTVQALDLLPILPQSPGLQIQQVLVDEGDYVTAGQVMAILDDSVVRSQILDAQAQVESLRSSQIQTEAGVWQAKSALTQAQAGETEAQAAISQAQAAKSEAEAGLRSAIAAKSEVEAALAGAQAAKVEAEAGRAQAVANLARAKAELAQAERELQRYQSLANAGAISQQELDIRLTTVENALEAVRVAEANIKSADARIQSAVANISSAEARVKSTESNVSSAAARVENAVANIRNAEARLERAAANVTSAQSQVESARATVNSAAANVRSSEARAEQVQTQGEQTLVRAPASGIVAERIARVGDVTSGSGKLFSIIANGELELHVKVPETQLPLVKIGASVKVTSDADSRIELQGTVREISPLIDANSRQATVKVSLPSSDLLRSGMFLRAALTTSTTEGLIVPAKAVLPQADSSSIVYRLTENDIVQAQPVQVGQVIDAVGNDLSKATIEIQSGLEVGDIIVVDGAAFVKSGDRVKVVDR
jgi:RND family efflux transporter MFP subunit